MKVYKPKPPLQENHSAFSIAHNSESPQYLMAFEGVQDGELSGVLQGEDDDFARVVESWRSSYQQTAMFG